MCLILTKIERKRMLSFFKNVPDRQSPRIFSNFQNILRTLHHNHEQIVKYWHGMNWSVKSDHVLVGLLLQLSSAANHPTGIYNSIRNYLDGFTMSRGIASGVGYGRIQPKSHFYGHECQEVLVEQPFDDALDQLFGKHYTEWETLRIIEHPFTSFDYQLANGKIRKNGEKGLCVIKMDLALLYTQYALWRRDTQRSKYEDGTVKSITNFVHTYPIVSLLKSHNERVWFNRLFNLAMGRLNIDEREDTRLRLLNPYLYIDDYQRKIIDELEKSRANFHEWCCWIPGIFSKNLKQHLIKDNVLETQQLKLPWLLGRLSTLEFLIHEEFVTNTHANKMYLSEIFRKHREYSGSQTYATIRGLDSKMLIKNIEDKIISLVDTLK